MTKPEGMLSKVDVKAKASSGSRTDHVLLRYPIWHSAGTV
jgi:hypothetical protein